MRGSIARELNRLAAKPGFTGPALKQLRRRLHDEWNKIPANERGRVDALELLSRATQIHWRNPANGEATEKA